MDEKQAAVNAILKSIGYLNEKALNSTTKIYNGIITSTDNDIYKIKYNGEIHSVPMKGIGNPKVNDVVNVFVPQGNQSLAWFCPNLINVIVNEGDSGIWHYRKWANGVAECWTRYNYDFSTYVEEKNGFYIYDIEIPYPFTFLEYPVVSGTFGADGFFSANWAEDARSVAHIRLASFYNYKYGKGNSAGIHINVNGKWK